MEEKNKKDISEMKAVAAVEVSEESLPPVKKDVKPVVKTEPKTESKTETKPAAGTESSSAEAGNEEEEIVFADNSMLNVNKESGKKDTYKKEEPSPELETEAADDSVVFAAAEKKPEHKPIPKQKEKKKSPVPAIIAIVAVLCVAAAGTIIAINMANKSVPTAAQPESRASRPAASQASITVASEQSKEQADVSITSEEPLEVSDVDTTNIYFGENVTIEGINLAGKTLTQAYDAMQPRVMDLRDKVAISIACDGKTYTLTQDDFDYDTNLSDALIQAYHYSRGEIQSPTIETTTNNGVTDFKVKTAINKDSVDKAVEKAAEKFDIQPVDARVTKFDPNAAEKFEFADGSNGFLVNKTELKENIESVLAQPSKSGSFSIQAKETPFKHSLKDVKANTKLIASHYTIVNNRYESNMNMELAVKAASGTIVGPGEIFSFNEMTGDTTTGDVHNYPNGVTGSYVPSTAIVRGEYKDEYGGGICQASTTIYNAAMKANMEPIERYPHAYPSVYADRGLDATIDYGNLDMKFKNNYEYPVYIATYVYDYNGDGLDELLVEFYGPLSTEYDEIVPVGWVNYAGSESYSAKAAKVFFKDGKEIKREFLISGSYQYKYDTYYSASSMIPADPENGPYVSPTYSTPRVFSPKGCGSAAPVEYGKAAEYLKKNT